MTLYLVLIISSVMFGVLWSRFEIWQMLSKYLRIPARVAAIVRNPDASEHHKERASQTAAILLAAGLARVWIKLIIMFAIAFLPVGIALISGLVAPVSFLESLYDPIALLVSLISAVAAAWFVK